MAAAGPAGVASAGYRWYLGAQVLSLAGTMMSYTALFWLVLHLSGGGAPALAAVDAAQCLPMLLFSRRAGIIVARHRAARIAMVTQAPGRGRDHHRGQRRDRAAQRGLAAFNAGFIGFVPAGAFAIAAIASVAGTRWALIVPGLAILACGTALIARTATHPHAGLP